LNNGSKLTRRLFAAAVAGSPAAFAQQQPAAPASQAAPAAPAAQAPPPPPPRRRPQPPEPLPFAETLTFARKDAEVRTTPYPLSQVRLLSGPCLKAADSNRAYLMRIAPDRLLHTFRLNAGLPTSAQPLGGWEEPRGELRGHTTGHYLSACALRAASAGDREMKARGDEMVAELAKCQAKLAGDLGAQGLTDEIVTNQQGPEVNKSPMSVPDLRASGKKLEDWIEPDGSAPLTFRATASSGNVTMKPLNQLWGRFATYWSVT
jgi:hypothetical protein